MMTSFLANGSLSSCLSGQSRARFHFYFLHIRQLHPSVLSAWPITSEVFVVLFIFLYIPPLVDLKRWRFFFLFPFYYYFLRRCFQNLSYISEVYFFYLFIFIPSPHIRMLFSTLNSILYIGLRYQLHSKKFPACHCLIKFLHMIILTNDIRIICFFFTLKLITWTLTNHIPL